jgi:hypothetical protein
MEILDLILIASYFLIVCCFIILIMSEEISEIPNKIKMWLLDKRVRKGESDETSATKNLHRTEKKVERREEALDYLVKNYFEEKKREEEYKKKLESYGIVRRWIYKKRIELRNIFAFVTIVIIKPSILALMTYSTILSIYLGTRIGLQITDFTMKYIPLPFNYILDVLILFPIGFSPGILSIILTYHVEKKRVKRLSQEYGMTT